LKEQISALASAQVPNSVIYAQIPELARQNCESAGLDYDSVSAGRYLLTPDQVHNRVRETKRVMLGHNVGDLAQTESLIDTAAETHYVDYTPLIFNGVRGGPVEQHFRLMSMDKSHVEVLRRRGAHKTFLDATYKVNDVQV
jgi:hypothetical protein